MQKNTSVKRSPVKKSTGKKIPIKKIPWKKVPQRDLPNNKLSVSNVSGAKHWWLRLYVAGQTPRSLTAFQNLKRICDEYLKDEYDIEVIDLLKNPHLAKGDQIIAIPTLVRNLPEPVKKIIGDLSNSERVLIGLDIKEKK